MTPQSATGDDFDDDDDFDDGFGFGFGDASVANGERETVPIVVDDDDRG